jgi:WD40 repeat protein
VSEFEIKDFDPTVITSSPNLNELWVGDKKGSLHVLDGNNFATKTVIEKKHNHGISSMAASLDGKLVASGDSYRYIYVFNTETKEEVGCFPYHSAKVLSLNFSKDSQLLLTTCVDFNMGVANLATKAKILIERPNNMDITAAVFDDENRLLSTGLDCSIRIWTK